MLRDGISGQFYLKWEYDQGQGPDSGKEQERGFCTEWITLVWGVWEWVIPLCVHTGPLGVPYLNSLDLASSLKSTEGSRSGLHTWVLLEKFYTKCCRTGKCPPVFRASVTQGRPERLWVFSPLFGLAQRGGSSSPGSRQALWGQELHKLFWTALPVNWYFVLQPGIPKQSLLVFAQDITLAVSNVIFLLTKTRLYPDHLELGPLWILSVINM